MEVYWRRRALLGAGLILVAVTAIVLVLAVRGGGSGSDSATGPAGSAGPAEAGSEPGAASSATDAPSSGIASPTAGGSSSESGASAGSGSPAGSAAVPAGCAAADLQIAASTSLPSYPIGASPGLNIVVTNAGAQPCVADLSDGNIVLLVYFGDARIWGSHDCSVEPGSSPQTLPVNEPLTRQIVWTGLSSNEGCTATRQRVGAGTYTLQPIFAGQPGTPTTFAIA